MTIKEKWIGFFGKKRKNLFFSRVASDFYFESFERKKYYEMVFDDGSITKLPKKMFLFLDRLSSDNHAKITIGKGTYLQNLCLGIQQDQQIRIGSFCSFGPNVTIKLDGVRGKMQFTQYPLDLIDPDAAVFQKQKMMTKDYNVAIGNDCFIGEDCKIMANVHIGDGVILGERSLVTAGKILEPFGIYVGQPVRLIGYRYDPLIIQELLRIQWWNWPLEKIQKSGLQHIDFIDQKEYALKVMKEME